MSSEAAPAGPVVTLDQRDRVGVVPLASRIRAPVPASARTRARPPAGYGVAEQCLPFTAAAALGFTIPAPFAWGYCNPADVPAGARRFRSPVAGGCQRRVFYVLDDPDYGFAGNQYTAAREVRQRAGPAPLPGLSFFERTDQQDCVKLHLPYIWRTAPGVALLFLAPLNRPRGDGLALLAGLVETDWYADAVNLVLQLPAAPERAVHVAAGSPVAQAVPVAAELRRASLEQLPLHKRAARGLLDAVRTWRDAKERDRAAYKRQARSQQGVLRDTDS
jgi:hypothetical protein